MEVTLPYTVKSILLDVLKDFIPIDIEKFTGSVNINLKCGEIGIVKYTGHIRIKYIDNSK